MKTVNQRQSPHPHWGHLAMSGRYFQSPNWRVRDVTGIYQVEASNAAKHPIIQRGSSYNEERLISSVRLWLSLCLTVSPRHLQEALRHLGVDLGTEVMDECNTQWRSLASACCGHFAGPARQTSWFCFGDFVKL